MRICRIVYEMPPPWDGLTPHPYEITQTQVKQGHEITIFCGRWPKAGPPEQVAKVKYIYIDREPLPATISLTSSVVLFFKYLLWRVANRPDILHCHGHFAIWIYTYRNMLKRFFPWASELSVPLVTHFHNTAKGRWESFKEADKYIMPHSRYIQWPLSIFSDKQAIKASAANIFVSQKLMEDAVKYYGADPKTCFVIETGVNSDLFKPINNLEKEKSRKDMHLDAFDKVIVNLGMMVERKNILNLVQAMKFLPIEYKLLLVGNWDSTYQPVVLKEIGQFGLEERVIRLSYTPYPMTAIAYQIADIFVLPSTFEGLPKAAMEALSCGVPALVSGFKLQQDLQGIFYLPNQDPQTIASGIQQVIDSHPKVDVNTVHFNFSWTQRIKEIDKVYDFAVRTTL